MEGLSIGRLVRYVESDGWERPALVTKVWNPEGLVNLVVFLDGTKDSFTGATTRFATSVSFNPEKQPLTWHWPERA